MKLDFLPLDRLSVSKTNMRCGRKAPDVSDILPTVRKRGVLQPIIVRPDASGDLFEIIAGSRRFHAALIVAAERADAPDSDAEAHLIPCAILDPGDDAAAIEASMIENMARRDADEVSQWVSFTRLVREGEDIDDIAATFGMPVLTVRRILALGNLLPGIRNLYAREEIDAASVRHLTLASKSQQREWLQLVGDPEAHAPTGHHLKSWLFGGQSIAARHALFDLEGYEGRIVADLFGDSGYFADNDAFWVAQNAAIDERRAAYLADGWKEVVIVPAAEQFLNWQHVKTGKARGGRVYIDVRANGEIVFHEGYATSREAARADKARAIGSESVARPEISGTMQNYLDLHRHAAVRARLLGEGGVAMRLMLVHAICGSHLWSVRVEPQTARNEAIAESVETCASETLFDERRRAVLALLGLSPEEPTVTRGAEDAVALFHRLLDLTDTMVIEVIALVMGETLAAGGSLIEAIGVHLGVRMEECWRPDPVFYDLIRDREILGRIVAEVAGETVAGANAAEKTKVLRGIIADHVAGENGRARMEHWVPRWMAFPPSAYTGRGCFGMVDASRAAGRYDAPEPDGDAEAMPLAA